MVLSSAQAEDRARDLMAIRSQELARLDRIREYLRDDPNRRLQGLPQGLPVEVHRLARVSRVNVLKYVLNARAQALYVDGYRTPKTSDDMPAWQAWQANRFDARQIGVHRAALAYGAAYATVLPGDSAPVIRGASPRALTAAYGDDDEWPEVALEQRANGRWRLLDDQAAYYLSRPANSTDRMTVTRVEAHDVGVCPVVRYRETVDLDDPQTGIIAPLFALQDQVNVTTFGLLVAQHFGAFRQRYIIGWLAEAEEKRLASASNLWTFEDTDITIGEFAQTNLSGYIDSREATLRHLSTLSQTPAHEMLGQLVNLSAEALAAAEASYYRALFENSTVLGESHEQTLGLASQLMGFPVEPAASVRWRDMQARSFAAVVDGLGKLAEMLGVPREELWEMIPGIPQDQVERWRAKAEQGDPFINLNATLERQAGLVGADGGNAGE